MGSYGFLDHIRGGPCEVCHKRQQCKVYLLACGMFYNYCRQGENVMKKPNTREPTAEIYDILYREDED